MKQGREFEQLIESIYREIDPDSKVTRNDKILGHQSKTHREIDLSIRSKIGLHEILIVVQAKDTKKPIDVNVVYEFVGVINDIKANKGVLISSKGFSKSAKSVCENYGIDMFTAHDFENPKWTLDLKMPVLLSRFEGAFRPDFRFTANQAYEKMSRENRAPKIPNWNDFKFTDDDGRSYFTAREEFTKLCTEGALVFNGVENVSSCKKEVKLFITDGVLVPVKELCFIYKVTKREYYKYFQVKEFRGLIDSLRNILKPVKFKVESDDVVIEDFRVESIQGIRLETWNPMSPKVKLIHPYKIFLHNLLIGTPLEQPKFNFSGKDPDFKE
ncbi:restriction endonuclease [Chryseolinea soli]|uniref:Restriction endonuclease n=1 Tax=Chryseolinea soli TaxID=2321403 RepID=A0A385SU69_9BACT|nr:restriction endonuclease [Chryseolinea soli]AYB34749.1 restriction endonuclease [Chryseolinea soli]